MDVYFPVTPFDHQLCDAVLAAHRLCPPGPGHNAVVGFGPNVSDKAAEFRKGLEEFYTTVLSDSYDMDPPQGWPKGPNTVFNRAARFMASTPGESPWLFFELDATPIAKNWLSSLERQWRERGLPCMGVVAPTVRVGADGTQSEDGVHMVGCGIYPHGFALRSVLIRFLDANDPFDVQLQYEVKNMGVAHTDQIGHHMDTKNYRLENGKVVCDRIKELPVVYHGVVPLEGKVLIHGCKDASLAKLLAHVSGKDFAIEPEPIAEPVFNNFAPDFKLGGDEKASVEDRIDAALSQEPDPEPTPPKKKVSRKRASKKKVAKAASE